MEGLKSQLHSMLDQAYEAELAYESDRIGLHDIIKVKRKRSQGLSARQKILLQVLLAAALGLALVALGTLDPSDARGTRRRLGIAGLALGLSLLGGEPVVTATGAAGAAVRSPFLKNQLSMSVAAEKWNGPAPVQELARC